MIFGLVNQRSFLWLLRLPWRKISATILLASALGYAVFGWEISVTTSAIGAKAELEELLAAYARNNPTMANDLARLRAEYGDIPVAAKLKLDSQLAATGEGVQPLSEQIKRNLPLQEVRLASLVQATGMSSNDPALEVFIAGYDEAMRILPDPQERIDILNDLDQASKSQSDWNYVQKGFFELLVWRATRTDLELWNSYTQKYDWLSEIVEKRLWIDLTSRIESGEESTASDAENRLTEILSVVREHERIAHTLYAESPDELVSALHILELYGKTIEITDNRYKIPLLETVAALYANPEVLEGAPKSGGDGTDPAEAQAAFLSNIYNTKPNVWKYCQTTPLAMQLYIDVPEFAEQVLDMYGNRAGFILQIYDEYGGEVLPAAVAAVVKYGDLGVYLLSEYRGHREFRDALANPEINTRIIPFAAKFPEMIVEASHNPGYVNKYFNEDGLLKDSERWWEALPGGSIAKIADNWRQGYPCDWSELGWGVYDAVDVALAVGTLGASKALTSTAKAGVKVASRSAARSIESAEVAVHWLQKNSKSLTRRAVAEGEDASRLAGKVVEPLRGAARGADEVIEATKVGTKSALTQASHDLRAMGDDLAEKIGRAGSSSHTTAWRRVGFGLMFAKTFAKKDVLAKAPEQLSQSVTQAGVALAQVPGTVLASFLKEIIRDMRANVARVPVPVTHGAISGLLLLGSGACWLSTRRRHVNPL